MPTYIDIHDLPGVKASDVVGAHEADVRVQDAYGVNYKHYWVDEGGRQGLLPRRRTRSRHRGPGPSRGPRSRSANALPGRTRRLADFDLDHRTAAGHPTRRLSDPDGR